MHLRRHVVPLHIPDGKHPDDHRAGTANHMHRLITDTELPKKLGT